MTVRWRNNLLSTTIIGVEGCWLYALARLFNDRMAGGGLSVPGLLLLFPVSFLFNALLGRIRWHALFLRCASWLAWAATALLATKIQVFDGLAWSDSAWLTAIPQAIAGVFYTFRPELLILIVSALLWQLGRRLARTRITFATAAGEFQFGLVILLVIFFLAVPLEADPSGSVPVVPVFFVMSLSGMSLAHAQEGGSWLSGVYRGQWAGLLTASIVLVLLLGLIVASMVNRDLIQVALNLLNWIWELTMKIVAFLVSLLPESGPPDLPPDTVTPGAAGGEEAFQLFSMPDWLRDILRLGWGIMMLSLTLLALWRVSTQIFLWLHRRLSGTLDTEFESLPGALRADILRLLRGILWLLTLPFRRHRRLLTAPSGVPPVRQVYRQLLRWTTRRGYPRSQSQTPQEYLDALVAMLPAADADLRLITAHYVATRYGAHSAGNDELRRVTESWRRVKRNRLRKADSQPPDNGGKAK